MKLMTATRRGQRLKQLETLAEILAKSIDNCADEKTLASMCKQYRETIREIELIKGTVDDEDEISEILTSRIADGKSGAVRQGSTRV